MVIIFKIFDCFSFSLLFLSLFPFPLYPFLFSLYFPFYFCSFSLFIYQYQERGFIRYIIKTLWKGFPIWIKGERHNVFLTLYVIYKVFDKIEIVRVNHRNLYVNLII